MARILRPKVLGSDVDIAPGAARLAVRPTPEAISSGLTGTQKALLLILTVKIVIFALVFIAWLRIDLYADLYSAIVHYQEPNQYGLLTRFTTWDSSHYLLVAENGYWRELHESNAFAPALPLLIRALAFATGSYIIAGLLISNFAAIIASYLFFIFTRKHWGEAVALRALVLLLAFPTSFYMSMVYTESLFLLLCVATFYFLSEGKLGAAALSAFLLPLTRWIGILVVVPVGLALLLEFYKEGLPDHKGRWPREILSSLRIRPRVAWSVAPLVGAAVYVLYMWDQTGDPLAHVHAASIFLSHWEVKNLLQPWKLMATTFGQGLVLHSYLNSSLDRIFFLGFLASAPLVYRKVSMPLFVFYLTMGMQPLLGSYMSYMRYLLPVFPLYIAWASYLEHRPRLLWGIVAVMVTLQVPFIALHTTNHWVS
jgi:hypothetical protein